MHHAFLERVGEIPADDSFDGQDQDVPTVEHGDGQQVEDTQLQAEEPEEPDEVTRALRKCIARDLPTFQEFVLDALTTAPNVASVKTFLTIRRAKRDPGVPITVPSEPAK